MKTIASLLFITILFFSCRKDDSPSIPNNGYPGALDSMVFYYVGDSANFTNPTTMYRFFYDNERRVNRINYGGEENTFFYYDGSSTLSNKRVDSFFVTGLDEYQINIHLYTYDNLDRVIYDSIISYRRSTSGMLFTPTLKKYSVTYQYQADYMTYKNSSNISYCHYTDSLFFNVNGDANRISKRCIASNYIQNVNEYYTDKNPLGELNIAPLFNSITTSYFYNSMHHMNFNPLQPEYMFKKISGKNNDFYIHNENELTELLFNIKKDASGRINDLVIAHHTYWYTPFVTGLQTDVFYGNYRFFYHP